MLAFGVAILNSHTRLTYLETSAPVPLLLAALGAAGIDMVHPDHKPLIIQMTAPRREST
jgi:hypothetical protein